MLTRFVNKHLFQIIVLILSYMLLSCNIQDRSIPATAQLTLTPSPNATEPHPLISPTNTGQEFTNPIENRCVEFVSADNLLTKAEGILLLQGYGDNYATYLFELPGMNRKDISFDPNMLASDFIIAPNRKLIAFTLFPKEGTLKEKQLIIVDTKGVLQRNLAWKREWGRLVSWSDNQNILLSRQVDMQLSTFNPEAIVMLNINSGEDVELRTSYPDRNQMNYVNWNLINYSFSPDFTRVLYPTSQVDPGYVNHVALFDMQNEEVVANLPVILSDTTLPEWSPNGKQVIIAGLIENNDTSSDKWRGQEIFAIDIHGKISQLSHFTEYYQGMITINHYAWSPDSQKIAFWLEVGRLQSPQLVVLNIVNGKTISYCISGLPYKQTSKPIWSPSGEFLALEFQKSENDVPRILLINTVQETVTEIAEGVYAIGWLNLP